jgi:hypothetical protein
LGAGTSVLSDWWMKAVAPLEPQPASRTSYTPSLERYCSTVPGP